MNNNKFIRNKTKFNPDVLIKLNNKDNERKTMKVDMINTIYNPITNIVPTKVTNQRDLLINDNNNNVDIKKRLHELSNERSMQDVQYKPVQTKLVQDNMTNMSINTFNDLKSNTTKETNKNKYYSVLDNLKELGIIK
jgi:hypothetical protein